MSATVVDASAIAAVLFMDESADSVRGRLSGSLVAPFLMPFELANVCRTKMASEPARAKDCLRRYRLLPRLAIDFAPIDFAALPEVALAHALSAYDAAYLLLALERGVPLVTLDSKLDRAWRRARKASREPIG